MPMISLDTHMLVYALIGDLRPNERRLLERRSWSVASIVLWELARLIQRDRIRLDMDERDLHLALARVHVWPLDLEIALASTRLDFRGDPADDLIAATSLVHRVPLLTRDERIGASRIVPLAL